MQVEVQHTDILHFADLHAAAEFLSGKGICVSAGSACSSHGKHVSRPLSAFGLAPADADCTIRLSFNHTNTGDEAREVARAIAEGVAKLAQIR